LIFSSFLQKIDIDPAQWTALAATFIKSDLRRSIASPISRTGKSGGKNFYILVLFYLLLGVSLIPFIVNQQDLFAINFVLLSYSMFVVGSQILIEYNSVIISPEDHALLAYLPVSSRTFFWAKLCNLLLYVLTFTAVIALPAVVTISILHGFLPALATGVAAFLSNLSCALLVVLLYALVLDRATPRRLQSFLSGFQVVLGIGIYGIFFALSYLLDGAIFDMLGSQQWPLFLPPGWFSSYVHLVSGHAGVTSWLLSALTLIWLGVLTRLAAGKLSLGYSEKLGFLAAGSYANPGRRTAARSVRIINATGPFEARVVRQLIVSQFREDSKFKMSVLAILPLTFFYFLIGTREGPLVDPFLSPHIQMGRSVLLYMLIFLFPMMLRTHVTHSDSYRASWAFYVSPIDLVQILVAEKNVLMRYFVLPFLGVLAGILWFQFEYLTHVLLHVLVLGLLAHLFLQLAFMFAPDLPFSLPNIKGQQSLRLISGVLVVLVILYVGFPFMFEYFYPEMQKFVLFIMALVILNLAAEYILRNRSPRFLRAVEFAD